MRTSTCGCAEEVQITPLTSADYSRAKRLLNIGRHPTFIGRGTFARCALNGGCFVASSSGADCGVALVNPKSNILLVLNIHPDHRSHGLGAAMLRYLQCNFARVLESAVPFFERNGYQSCGEMHQGKTLKTQVMIKSSLIPLAGRVAKIYGTSGRASDIQAE